MRDDFERGGYNIGEHDHITWTDEQLQNRLNELHENTRIIRYSGERLAQVNREIGLIAMEMSERFRERKNQDIEEAWRRHGGV